MNPDQAYAYASLVLIDGGKELTAENITAVLTAQGVKADPAFTAAFEQFFKIRSPEKFFAQLDAAPTTAAAAPVAAPPPKEKTPEEEIIAVGFGASSSSEESSSEESD